MRTNKIKAKPFRIISEGITYSHLGTSLVHFQKTSKYVMEYKNPKAQELYMKAQATRDIYKKAELFEQMGDYELKSLNFKEHLQEGLNKLLSLFLFK